MYDKNSLICEYRQVEDLMFDGHISQDEGLDQLARIDAEIAAVEDRERDEEMRRIDEEEWQREQQEAYE